MSKRSPSQSELHNLQEQAVEESRKQKSIGAAVLHSAKVAATDWAGHATNSLHP